MIMIYLNSETFFIASKRNLKDIFIGVSEMLGGKKYEISRYILPTNNELTGRFLNFFLEVRNL